MKVYYATSIYATHIEEAVAGDVTDDMKCFYITRMVQTDTGRIYEDKLNEAIWNPDYMGLTEKEAKEKAAKLNEIIDSSKPLMTEFEKLEQDCKYRESLKALIELRKTELLKLEEQLKTLDLFIKCQQKNQEAPTAGNLNLRID